MGSIYYNSSKDGRVFQRPELTSEQVILKSLKITAFSPNPMIIYQLGLDIDL